MAFVPWPTGHAQDSLQEALGEPRFAEITITVWGDKASLEAKGLQLRGEAAKELRTCIDDRDECSDSTLAGLLPEGNGDGTVQQSEVDAVEKTLLGFLDLVAGDIRERAQDLVKIDSQSPARPKFTLLDLAEATGSVTKTGPILITVRLEANFDGVNEQDTHAIRFTRESSDLNITSRVVLQSGPGWTIKSDTVVPASMQKFLVNGRFSGAQDDFESTEPLVFDIESTGGGASYWLWIGLSLLVLLAVAGGAYYLFVHRQKA